ncbi:hypothetical protein DSECCO2_651310 [anaerobic digester metagenome]
MRGTFRQGLHHALELVGREQQTLGFGLFGLFLRPLGFGQGLVGQCRLGRGLVALSLGFGQVARDALAHGGQGVAEDLQFVPGTDVEGAREVPLGHGGGKRHAAPQPVEHEHAQQDDDGGHERHGDAAGDPDAVPGRGVGKGLELGQGRFDYEKPAGHGIADDRRQVVPRGVRVGDRGRAGHGQDAPAEVRAGQVRLHEQRLVRVGQHHALGVQDEGVAGLADLGAGQVVGQGFQVHAAVEHAHELPGSVADGLGEHHGGLARGAADDGLGHDVGLAVLGDQGEIVPVGHLDLADARDVARGLGHALEIEDVGIVRAAESRGKGGEQGVARGGVFAFGRGHNGVVFGEAGKDPEVGFDGSGDVVGHGLAQQGHGLALDLFQGAFRGMVVQEDQQGHADDDKGENGGKKLGAQRQMHTVPSWQGCSDAVETQRRENKTGTKQD